MHITMEKLARLFAILGGTVLSALIVMTCLSVVGRSLNSVLHGDVLQTYAPAVAGWFLALGIGPINGDFEVVEAGMAFVIFAFIPLCQLHGAHASVDIFTQKMPKRMNVSLRAVIEVIFAAIIVLIAWQLSQGMVSKLNSGQTTLLLQFPVWWGYAFCLTGAVAAAVIAVYVAAMRCVEMATGRQILTSDMEAEH